MEKMKDIKTFVAVAISGIVTMYPEGYTLNDIESLCIMLNQCELFNLSKEQLRSAIIEVIRQIY